MRTNVCAERCWAVPCHLPTLTRALQPKFAHSLVHTQLARTTCVHMQLCALPRSAKKGFEPGVARAASPRAARVFLGCRFPPTACEVAGAPPGGVRGWSARPCTGCTEQPEPRSQPGCSSWS